MDANTYNVPTAIYLVTKLIFVDDVEWWCNQDKVVGGDQYYLAV